MNHSDGVFESIPTRFPRPYLYQKLKLKDHPDLLEEFDLLVDEATTMAHPKAIFRSATIQSRGNDFIEIDGHRLNSTLLASQLVTSDSIYLVAATCGEELEQWAAQIKDPLKQYWIHVVLGIALERAMRYLRQHLNSIYHPGHLSVIEPGANKYWSLEGQDVLFKLLGDLPEKIGLSLNPGYIMQPSKSISGVMFPTNKVINRCRLCDSETCFERTRQFDASLFL
jgi:hypothetical protein